MWECVPHLMQQNEIPMKGYKISKVEHFTITQLDKKKWTNTKTDLPKMTYNERQKCSDTL